MNVIRRDGTVVPFRIEKIERVLEKAGVTGTSVGHVASAVIIRLAEIHQDSDEGLNTLTTVEQIQNVIEQELMACGLYVLAKSYILYRHDHHKQRVPKCKQPSESFVPEYPRLIAAADRQAIDMYWNHMELDLTKDIHEFRTKLTDAERHAVMYLQRLFTQYEGYIGEEYWLGRFRRIFPRHEFQRWASVAGMTELQIHAPFYQKLNTLLNLEVDGFYTEYKKDPVLSERMAFVGRMINDPDDLVSLAAFALLEGVVLFSAFAFFKHFQANGKNLLPAFVAGINFSARDEALHADVGAYCYWTLRNESFLSDLHRKQLEDKVLKVAATLYDHELDIIDNLFMAGGINGASSTHMKIFVASRVDKILDALDIHNHGYHCEINPVAEWFYDSVEAYNYNDFFAKKGREYSRRFKRTGFTWRNPDEVSEAEYEKQVLFGE